jgi:hypothetical protein
MARLSGTVNRIGAAKGIGLIARAGATVVVLSSVIQAEAREPSPAGRRGLV